MSRRKKDFTKSLQYNELLHQYRQLGTAIFEWKGLSEIGVPIYEPEKTLYRNGQCCMMQIPGTDTYGIFPVAYGSVNLDLYGNPLTWRAYVVGDSPVADTIRNTVLSSTEVPGTEPSVLIWNDSERYGTEPYVRLMVGKMLNVDIALDSNINIQKTPFIVNCNNKNLLTAKNFYEQIQVDADGVYLSNDIEGISIDVLNLGVSFIGAELSDQYKTFENRILEYLGIANLPVEKQERMLTGEVSSNDDKTNLMFESRLLMRKRACEQMKEIFGLSIEVDKRELPQANLPNMYGTQSTGGEDTDVGEQGNDS